MKEDSKNDLFEKAPIPRAYFTFALPVVFSMVVSLVYNMVDTFFIAQTGNTDLVAGVSLSAPVFTLMIALGDIFGLGGSSVISRLFGQKLDKDGKRLSVFCFYGAIACGILVTVLLLLFRGPVLTLLGADRDTMTYASQYYTYIALGAPFIIVSYTPLNLLRTEGFATASMVGSILGAGLYLYPGDGGCRCGYCHGDRQYLYRPVFSVVPFEEKQAAVCRSQRISYPKGRTGTDLCHWDSSFCYKFNAEPGNGPYKPFSPPLWK